MRSKRENPPHTIEVLQGESSPGVDAAQQQGGVFEPPGVLDPEGLLVVADPIAESSQPLERKPDRISVFDTGGEARREMRLPALGQVGGQPGKGGTQSVGPEILSSTPTRPAPAALGGRIDRNR
ncbi:hypothetical protein GCM10009851_09820 [Herbiconiux moechotypicola]|uniref:Uncharacterized protein n=1 Tax=Herbiconiux moechotypicola TaxID=637393 RepID=A0ABN3DCU0_9MICO